jgi:hypothetical protein
MAASSSSLSFSAFLASFPVRNGGRKEKDDTPALHLPSCRPTCAGAAASAWLGPLLTLPRLSGDAERLQDETEALEPGVASSGSEEAGAHGSEASAMARRGGAREAAGAIFACESSQGSPAFSRCRRRCARSSSDD